MSPRGAAPGRTACATGHSPGGTRLRERKAKAVCASCPVRLECLNYAVARPEKYGTWGGLNEDERSAERRRRMRRANAA